MTQGLTKIDVPGSQSVCYHQHIAEKNFFWKEYKSIVDKTTLETYHALHQQYGKVRYTASIDNPIKIHGQTISKVSYVILPLSVDQIGVAVNRDQKVETIVSTPSYVSGVTLDSYYAQLMGNDGVSSKIACMCIVHVIEAGLLELFNHSTMHGLSPTNMKVVSVKNGTMYIVITDLAIRIPEYVSYQQSS